MCRREIIYMYARKCVGCENLCMWGVKMSSVEFCIGDSGTLHTHTTHHIYTNTHILTHTHRYGGKAHAQLQRCVCVCACVRVRSVCMCVCVCVCV